MAPYDKNTKLLISASAHPGNNGTYFYNAAFKALDINAIYIARKFDNAETLFGALRAMNIYACSVSSPLKVSCVPFANECLPIVKNLGSLNSLRQIENGRYLGTNTDAIGFKNVLQKSGLHITSTLIYGSGGVIPALIWALREFNPNIQIAIYSRDLGKAHRLADHYKCEVYKIISPHADLFINATPAQPTTQPLLAQLSEHSKTVFDISASKKEAELLQIAKLRNQKTMSGFEMFLEQFKAQFEFYFDRPLSDETLQTINNQASIL